MDKLRVAVQLETAFGIYTVDEVIGEGGAGRVYGGLADGGARVAVKVLHTDRATKENRKRFKNEVAFLAQNKHANIVTVIDHGVAQAGDIRGPFYVMRRYAGSLRDLMNKKIAPADILRVFSQMLDGVEAAHMKGAIHRDLKPENFLYDTSPLALAVADFGVASFTADLVATPVETPHGGGWQIFSMQRQSNGAEGDRWGYLPTSTLLL